MTLYGIRRYESPGSNMTHFIASAPGLLLRPVER